MTPHGDDSHLTVEILNERINSIRESCEENKLLAIKVGGAGLFLLLSVLGWGALQLMVLNARSEVRIYEIGRLQKDVQDVHTAVEKLADKVSK